MQEILTYEAVANFNKSQSIRERLTLLLGVTDKLGLSVLYEQGAEFQVRLACAESETQPTRISTDAKTLRGAYLALDFISQLGWGQKRQNQSMDATVAPDLAEFERRLSEIELKLDKLCQNHSQASDVLGMQLASDQKAVPEDF